MFDIFYENMTTNLDDGPPRLLPDIPAFEAIFSDDIDVPALDFDWGVDSHYFELSVAGSTVPSNMTGTDPLDALRWGSALAGASDSGTLTIPYIFQQEMKDWVQIEFIQVHALDWDEYEMQQVRLALDMIETFIDVEFVEVFDTSEAVLNFGVMSSLVFSFVLGRFVPPGEEDAGFGFFNRRGLGWDREGDGGLEIGGSAFEVIIHEIGHGLGLAHPHDEGGTSTVLQGVEGSSDLGAFNLNQSVYTVMSYNDGWELSPAGIPDTQDYGYNASFSPFDIAVLQELYGANPNANTGNTIYLLPEMSGGNTSYSSIWDTGGTDTIMSNSDGGAVINLNAASLQYEEGGGGHVSHNNGVIGGMTIANDALIENAIGSNGADVITGNAAKNVLAGRGGDDELWGGEGADIFRIERGAGADMIMDFENGVDRIEFSGLVSGYNDLSMRQDGDNVIIKSSNGLTILAGMDIADIDITDFAFRQEASSISGQMKKLNLAALLKTEAVEKPENDFESPEMGPVDIDYFDGFWGV